MENLLIVQRVRNEQLHWGCGIMHWTFGRIVHACRRFITLQTSIGTPRPILRIRPCLIGRVSSDCANVWYNLIWTPWTGRTLPGPRGSKTNRTGVYNRSKIDVWSQNTFSCRTRMHDYKAATSRKFLHLMHLDNRNCADIVSSWLGILNSACLV